MRAKQIDDADKKSISLLYRVGIDIKTIAQLFGVYQPTIRKVLSL